jgi:hypothetical protein
MQAQLAAVNIVRHCEMPLMWKVINRGVRWMQPRACYECPDLFELACHAIEVRASDGGAWRNDVLAGRSVSGALADCFWLAPCRVRGRYRLHTSPNTQQNTC